MFGEKEAWMVPMNSFIESRLEDFRVFLLRSSKRPPSDDISRTFDHFAPLNLQYLSGEQRDDRR